MAKRKSTKDSKIDWTKVSPAIIDLLRDPSVSLPRYGQVIDQKTDQSVMYDPYRITEKLQATIIKFFSEAPKTQHGQDIWLSVLKYRQGGASTCAEFAAFPKVAWTLDTIMYALRITASVLSISITAYIIYILLA